MKINKGNAFLLRQEDRENAELIAGKVTPCIEKRYNYKTDDAIKEMEPYIVTDMKVNHLPNSVIAFKYGIPLKLLKTMFKDSGKVNGLYMGKVYSASEIARLSVGSGYSKLRDMIIDEFGEYIDMQDVDISRLMKIIGGHSGRINLNDVSSELCRLGVTGRSNPLVKTDIIEARANTPEGYRILKKCESLRNIEGYSELTWSKRRKVKKLAEAISERVVHVGPEEVYMNMPIDDIKGFIDFQRST